MKSLLKVGKKAVAKAATRAKEDPATALREMKQDWLNKTGRNLEDDLVMLPETSLARKPTKAERKQQLRQTTRKIVKEMKKKMDETAMESCLQDRQSFSAYKRQRGRASFESPTEKRARYASSTKKVKSYSPTKPEWDSEAVLDEARQWPKDKPMNWTAFARKHHIPGRNCGQVVKEFCRQNKVDVLQLEGRTEPRRPMRPRYLKFGCGVSFPVQKNISEIKEDIRQAVNEGRYLQGEECKGTVLVSYTNKNGEVERVEVEVHGSKIPLIELRKHLLQRHEEEGYMRNHTRELEEYVSMERADVVAELVKLDEFDKVEDTKLETHELATRLYNYHHTRLLLLGNDHADLLGHSHLLEVIQVVYDPALFVSDEEFQAKTGRNVNVQAAVETPVIRLLSMSGSSEEEQLRVVPDRIADLHCSQQPIARAKGDPLVDKFVGYIGDLQGRWHEAGLQKGGEYRCGAGCGCPSSLLPCYASNVSHTIPTYEQLQMRAIAGMYGKQVGYNLHSLPVEKMRAELQKRGEVRQALSGIGRDELQIKLKSILQGLQRVPALLAFTPTARLDRYALEDYQVMPCEPLHDLKGHVSHILTELPRHVPKEAGDRIKEITNATVGEHNRGCDWRKALFLVSHALQDRTDCSPATRKLVRLLADIASIVYARASKRSPKLILHLSLCLWRHFELIQEVIGEPKSISLGALYGGYLHGLLHSPVQLAVISLSSSNTEAIERQQSQTRAIATATTSRRPNEIVSSVMIRVQAETERALENQSGQLQDRTVERIAKQLYPLGCTIVRVDKLSNQSQKENFLALMKTIAPFLHCGEGVWWHNEGNILFFHDGDREPCFRSEGPRLRHIRSCTPQKWQQHCLSSWQCILDNNITLPVSPNKLDSG